MARMLKLTPLYFIKYILTAHHFRSDMMVIARNSILIKNSLSIIFKASMVGVWGLKNTGSVTEEKAIIFLRLDHFMYFIPFEGKFNVEKSSQTSFFNLIIIFLFFCME